MNVRPWWMAAAIAVAVFAGLTGIRIESSLAQSTEPACVVSTHVTVASPDHAYEATLIEKNCNQGEALFYSVRVEAKSPPLARGWFVPGYALENDAYPTVPVLRWVSPRRLEIEVRTRTLSGALTLNAGEDLTVVRRYVATQPGAKPNF